jgi:hypothetical protein
MDAPLVAYLPDLESELEELFQADDNALDLAPPLPCGSDANAPVETDPDEYTEAEWEDWCDNQDAQDSALVVDEGVPEFHSAFTQQVRDDVDIVRDNPYLVTGVTLPNLVNPAPPPPDPTTLPSPISIPIAYGGPAAVAVASSSASAAAADNWGKRKTPDDDP